MLVVVVLVVLFEGVAGLLSHNDGDGPVSVTKDVPSSSSPCGISSKSCFGCHFQHCDSPRSSVCVSLLFSKSSLLFFSSFPPDPLLFLFALCGSTIRNKEQFPSPYTLFDGCHV